MNALQQLVADHMAAEDLTIETVARRSGLAASTVGAYKIGKRGARPTRGTLTKLAAGLGLSAETLFAAAGLTTDDSLSMREARQERLLALYQSLADDDRRMVDDLVRVVVRHRG